MKNKIYISAIIVAGGSGNRMQSDIPKQFMLLCGMPILMRTVENIKNFVDQIIIVLPEAQIDYWQNLCEKYNFNIDYTLAHGGGTRFESVKNGLKMVSSISEIVLVHDGVRPFADGVLIEEVIDAARESGAAVPVTEIVDSLRMVCNDGSQIVDRCLFRAVQTPQAFGRELLMRAYEQSFSARFTDDASVVESIGYHIRLTKGDPRNIKITTQADLDLANYIIKKDE